MTPTQPTWRVVDDTHLAQRLVRDGRVVECKICGSDGLRSLYTSAQDGLPVVRCERCGLVFVGRGFSNEAQRAFYGNAEDTREFAEAEQSLPEVAERHREWLDQIQTYLPAVSSGRKPRLLDIGAGAGDFLAVARDRGFDVHGIEVSAPAARLAREWHGIEVAVGNVKDDLRDGYFDVVTLIGTLEHVVDPAALLRGAGRLVAPGGLLFIYTPIWGIYDRAGSLVARITGGRLSRPIDRRVNRAHLQIFSAETLSRALDDLGMDTLLCDRVCEYNLPVMHYLTSLGVASPRVNAVASAAVKMLIDRKLFFRNNMRVVARRRAMDAAAS
jgi:2-polyprenyl-3-methyl-5-hydroxy-6-metoxy-1,4-benzoquinol methylase